MTDVKLRVLEEVMNRVRMERVMVTVEDDVRWLDVKDALVALTTTLMLWVEALSVRLVLKLGVLLVLVLEAPRLRV